MNGFTVIRENPNERDHLRLKMFLDDSDHVVALDADRSNYF